MAGRCTDPGCIAFARLQVGIAVAAVVAETCTCALESAEIAHPARCTAVALPADAVAGSAILEGGRIERIVVSEEVLERRE